MDLANLEFPKKVSYAPRKKRERGRPRWTSPGESTLTGWRCRKTRGSSPRRSTAWRARATARILSLHFVRLFSQLHILLPAKTQDCVKGALDAVEKCCEGAFADVFPVMLRPWQRASELLEDRDWSRRHEAHPHVLLRPGEARVEGDLREEPRRAAEGHTQGHRLRPAYAVGRGRGLEPRQLLRAGGARRRVDSTGVRGPARQPARQLRRPRRPAR